MTTRFAAALLASIVSAGACRSGGAPPPTQPTVEMTSGIASDQALFQFVTITQPFASYGRFPSVDVLRSGTSAHQPFVRVSMNAMAFAALQNGRLPAGSEFPTGSLIFKEVLSSQSGAVDVWALMYKDRANSHAGEGWLWAEIRPSGAIVYSITDRGRACTGCHSLEQGPQNDLVRTFERQR